MPKQEWIRAALKEKGFKLKDVAEALKLPPPRITDILTGKREVQSDEIEPLSDMLGMSPRSLLRSLQDGEYVVVPGDDTAPRLPVLGMLMADGSVAALPADVPFSSVAPPPDASTPDGLSVFLAGDQSSAPIIPKGSLIIVADPRLQFVPIAPGGIYLVSHAGKLLLRRYDRASNGHDSFVPVGGLPGTGSSFAFSLLPEGLGPKPAPDTLGMDNIIGGVMWVQTRLGATT